MVVIQSGAVDAELGKRYAVSIRSQEFGSYDFEGTLTRVHPIAKSHFSGRPGFDFLSFDEVRDLEEGVLGDVRSLGRGARDFTIASLMPID